MQKNVHVKNKIEVEREGSGKPGWREGSHDSPATLRPADLIVFPPRPGPERGTPQQGVSGLLGWAARGKHAPGERMGRTPVEGEVCWETQGREVRV